MMVSMMTAVLPVCRSPMPSSRWPRPIGISASIAFNPVCTGSCTDLRGMMPGAFTSTRPRTTSVSGPLPSIGVPSPSTTRPSKPLPTGTSTIVPVRVTVSPSRICLSLPKITTPTLSVSRFNAMPRRPAPGNSTISPAMQFCRPNTRAMPSPTDSTWPVSATLASVSNAAICLRRISEISAGRISISGGSLHGELQALQPGLQGRVVQAGSDAHDEAAEQVGFHRFVDVDVAVAGLDQAGAQLLALHVAQRMRRGDLGGDDAAALRHQLAERAHHVAQGAQAAVGGDDADEIAHRLAEAFGLQHGEGRPDGGVDVDQWGFQQAAKVGAGVDQAAEVFHFGHHLVQRVAVFGMGIEGGSIPVGHAAAGCDDRAF